MTDFVGHEQEFLHDETCAVCLRHRREIDAVRYAMLTDLRSAMGEDAARPWSPAEEWDRLIRRLSESRR